MTNSSHMARQHLRAPAEVQAFIGDQSIRLLRLREVCATTGLSRSTIYRLIADGDFPKPVKISKGRVAWRVIDLAEWFQSRGGALG